MGLSFAMLTLTNPRKPEQAPVVAEALADTGAVYLIIPEHIQLQLGLEEQSRKEVTLADGSKKWCLTWDRSRCASKTVSPTSVPS